MGREAILEPPPPNPKQDLRLTVTVAVTYGSNPLTFPSKLAQITMPVSAG